jgi:hypothetical protein
VLASWLPKHHGDVTGRGVQKRSRSVCFALNRKCLDMSPAKPPQRSAVVLRAGLVALLPLIGLGCDESPEPQTSTATPAPQHVAQASLPQIKWLDANDGVTPERWLASRAANADLPETAPQVTALRTKLDSAAEHFRDPPRMIANRAVQLEGMLAANGIEESAPELIQLLSAATADTGLKEGFGAVCQHYFNLRQQGADRDAALEQLKRTSFLSPADGAHPAQRSEAS